MVRHVATLGIGLLLLALLAITALSLGHRREAPLRVGVSPWPGAEALFLAQDHGLLAAAGLRVERIEYASFSDVASAFGHGDVDAMLGTAHEVVTVCARSQRRPVVVRATDQSIGQAATERTQVARERPELGVASAGPTLLFTGGGNFPLVCWSKMNSAASYWSMIPSANGSTPESLRIYWWVAVRRC